MKKSLKIALISIPAVITAGVTAVSAAVYASKPENYIKRRFPNAQILDIRHGVSGFMFDTTPYIEYTLYDPENEVTFFQRFDEGLFHKPYNSHNSYDDFMKVKGIYDRFLAEVPRLYSGEYFGRYDLNSQGLYIFLKEPEYEAVYDLMTALNASENKIEYVMYCLPADIYGQMKEQNFKRLSVMDNSETYPSYCFNLVEMFLGFNNDISHYSRDATPEMFYMGNAMVIRSGFEDASGTVGLIYPKHYYKTEINRRRSFS